MKIEEAVKWMEEAIQDTKEFFDQCSPGLQKELTEQKEVFELAITALRSMPEAGEPEPPEEKPTMQHKELTAQLRRMSVETGSLVCLSCGYEHNCGIHGCALLRQAVETIERQAAALEDLSGHECSGLVEE